MRPVVVVVRFPLEEIKYIFRFFFSFVQSGVETKCGVASATQHATPPEFDGKFDGKQSVSTQGSPCLPCCARDTA